MMIQEAPPGGGSSLAYELDRENRLLYSVIRAGRECTVQLLLVCSHKKCTEKIKLKKL